MRQRLDITDVEARPRSERSTCELSRTRTSACCPGPRSSRASCARTRSSSGLDPHLLVEEYRVRTTRATSPSCSRSRGPRVAGRDRRPRRGARPGLPVAARGRRRPGAAAGARPDRERRGDNGQASAATRRPRRRRSDHDAAEARQAAAPPPRTVQLRIVPAEPTYVCVDKGAGTPVVYEDTLERPETWKAKHLRVNLGRRDVQLTDERQARCRCRPARTRSASTSARDAAQCPSVIGRA